MVTFGIIGLVAVLVVVLILRERGERTQVPTGVGEGQAGCTDIERPEIQEPTTHVPDGTRVQYSTAPPTSGQHYGEPGAAGFYEPTTAAEDEDETFVHNLEHGQIVIWYSPAAPQSVIDDIEAYVTNQPSEYDLTLLGVPYDQVPQGFNFTLTAWGGMQSCEEFSSSVVDEFRREFQGKGPEQFAEIPPFTGT